MGEHPGCFGLASAVDASCASCRACSVKRECLIDAAELLLSMPLSPLVKRERLQLIVTTKQLVGFPAQGARPAPAPSTQESPQTRKKAPVCSAQLDMIARMPKRIGQQVLALAQGGWFEFATQELHAGRNPADSGWKRVLCQLLLKGGTGRRGFELALVEQLDLKPASAKTQASVGFAIMAAGRVAVEIDGLLQITPN